MLVKGKNLSKRAYHSRSIKQVQASQESNLNRLERENFWINMQDDLKRLRKVDKHDPYLSQYDLGLFSEIFNVEFKEYLREFERTRIEFQKEFEIWQEDKRLESEWNEKKQELLIKNKDEEIRELKRKIQELNRE